MPITGTVSPADSSAARRDAINTPRPGSSRSWSEVVFTPQQGLNYGETEPTKAMPAYIPPTEQPVQPTQPNQFGADDGDVLQ